jgi:hypothetical protein
MFLRNVKSYYSHTVEYPKDIRHHFHYISILLLPY